MTPRTEVDWLDVGMDADAVKIALLDSGHTRLPVAEGSIDAVIGVVATRDIVATLLDGRAIDLRAIDRKSVVEGKSVSVRVDFGGRRILKKKKDNYTSQTRTRNNINKKLKK